MVRPRLSFMLCDCSLVQHSFNHHEYEKGESMEVDCVPETDEEKPVGVGKQLGFPCSPFRSGSRFKGFQQSKGNKYQVEVIIQVHAYIRK